MVQAREVVARIFAADGLWGEIDPRWYYGPVMDDWLEEADKLIGELERAGYIIVRKPPEVNRDVPQEVD